LGQSAVYKDAENERHVSGKVKTETEIIFLLIKHANMLIMNAGAESSHGRILNNIAVEDT
jgi:hypothetical protein